MKKTRMTTVHSPRPDGIHSHTKKYSVYLQPGQHYRFDNKQAARNYVLLVSRTAQDCLAELNVIYGQLFLLYREAWNYSSTAKYARMLEPVQRDLMRALGRFDAATTGGTAYQGDALKFNAITDLCELLQDCAGKLAAIFAARTIYHSRHTCLAHQRRVQELHGYVLAL